MNLRARLTERACWLPMAAAIVLPGQIIAQVQLEQVTYIGGSGFDRAQGCAIDNNGFIYIAGNTKSTNLPATPGVVQQSNNGDQDAFVAKFSPDLKQLVALTYWGSSGEDRGYGVNVDAAGNIYLSGITKSPTFFTTPGAFDRSRDGTVDVFLSKFSPDLKTVLFSTLLGSSSASILDADWTRGGIKLDSQNNIYLTGRTSGPDFPTTPGAFATTYAGGQHDAFITKIKSDGSDLLWSTYVGGANGGESFYGNLVLHSDGSVYAAGYSNADDFPVTPGVLDSSLDGGGYNWTTGEGVVTRFKADGSAPVYSTYLWGATSGNDGLAVDSGGRAYVLSNVTVAQAGNVSVSSGAFQSSHGGGMRDMTIAILSADGSLVERASFLGGQGEEEASGIALDNSGNIIFGGNTSSTDFPVTSGSDVVQSSFSGGVTDAFIAVMDQQMALLYSTYLGGPGLDRVRCVTYGPNDKVVISGDTDGGFPGVAGGYDATQNGDRDGFIALFSVAQAGGGGTMVPDITVADPVVPFDDLSVDFGDVDVNGLSSKVITVANNGNADLTIGQVGQGNPLAAPFAIQDDTCSLQTLAPGDICTIKIRFSPAAQQLFNDSFDIPSDDPDEATVIVSLSGTGIPAGGGGTMVPDITVADPVAPFDDLSVDFGDVDVNGLSSKVITVANNGNADLTIGQVGQGNPLAAPFAIQDDTCSLQTLAPGGICAIKIRFSPVAQNNFNDKFNIPSDDPDEATVIVSLSGTGIPAGGGGTQTVAIASGGGGGGGGCSLATQNRDSRQAGAWGLLLLFIAGLAGRRGLRRTGCG